MTVVAVVGLGYVGLPLAVEFGKKRETVGYDLSRSKVESYRGGVDPTGEVSANDFQAASHLHVTNDPAEMSQADFNVISVPTQEAADHQPYFSDLFSTREY